MTADSFGGIMIGMSNDLGNYERKQQHSSGKIFSWSHSSRLEKAAQYVRIYSPKSILDYGSGDGTFLKNTASLVKQSVGVDFDEKQINDCKSRLELFKSIQFYSTREFDFNQPREKYDLVFCMEVIEHCVEDQTTQIIENLKKIVSSNGRIIISVPIETGLSLLFKQIFRNIAALRRVGDYQYLERYSLKEFIQMLFAGEKSKINRPEYEATLGYSTKLKYHGHKGFNYKSLKHKLDSHFFVEAVEFTPLPFSFLASQAWFICRLK